MRELKTLKTMKSAQEHVRKMAEKTCAERRMANPEWTPLYGDGYLDGYDQAQAEYVARMWHDADEVPEAGHVLLVRVARGNEADAFPDEETRELKDFFHADRVTEGDWKAAVERDSIFSWCYAADVVPC